MVKWASVGTLIALICPRMPTLDALGGNSPRAGQLAETAHRLASWLFRRRAASSTAGVESPPFLAVGACGAGVTPLGQPNR